MIKDLGDERSLNIVEIMPSVKHLRHESLKLPLTMSRSMWRRQSDKLLLLVIVSLKSNLARKFMERGKCEDGGDW